MTATLTLTPNPAKVGDQIVAVASDVGAPVKAVLTTALAGANNDLKFTAVTPGTAGNSIAMVYADPGGNNAALSVTVGGTTITVHLATGVAGAITSTASQVLAAITASAPANALVTAALAAANDGTGVVTALGSTPLAGGTDTTVTALSLQILKAGDADAALTEVVTLAAAGTATTVGDFTYEVDEAGYYKFKLIGDGTLLTEVDLEVFSS